MHQNILDPFLLRILTGPFAFAPFRSTGTTLTVCGVSVADNFSEVVKAESAVEARGIVTSPPSGISSMVN